MQKLVQFMSSLGDKPSDGEDAKKQHIFLIYLALLMCLGGLIWGTFCLLTDLFLHAMVPFAYILMTAINLTYLYFTKDFERVQALQLFISLILPFFFQVALGGFVASGGMIMWSLVAVFASFTCKKNRSIIVWFALFVGVIIISGLVDGYATRFKLGIPDNLSILFFVLNIITLSFIMFTLFYYFVGSERKVRRSLEKNLIFVKEAQSKLDIQNEELKKNQILMIQQARLASAGEMIGNIAHQWRQPLNTLGLVTQKLSIYQKKGLLNEKILGDSVDKSMEIINKMSTTIDDFRDFFDPKKEKSDFLVTDEIARAYAIIEASLSHNDIDYQVLVKEEGIQVHGYANEFSQVMVNLLSNAQDVLVEKDLESKRISVEINRDDEKLLIKVCDNGGGIAAEHIDKVFEPYFTTKEEGKGTGIGLYMSRTIIEEHMGGRLYAKNCDNGVCFTIEL